MIPDLDVLAQYGKRFQKASCTITRDAQGAFDPDTGIYDDPTTQTVYSGSCLVQPAGGGRTVEFGEGPTALRTYEVHLDGAAEGVQVGDEVAVSGSRDPELDGADSLLVIDVPKTSTLTNRQIIVEERQPRSGSPDESS